ncbi:MAG: VOC family protein [Aggregatilineales bacterium]
MIRHIAGVAEVVEDVAAAARFYRETLGVPVEYEPGSAYAVVKMPGILHFGLWQRRAAAESVFGDPNADDRIPLGFSVAFEVDTVAGTAAAIAQHGETIVQPPKTEPWGQKTTRLFGPSGTLTEFSETPWARKLTQDVLAAAET